MDPHLNEKRGTTTSTSTTTASEGQLITVYDVELRYYCRVPPEWIVAQPAHSKAYRRENPLTLCPLQHLNIPCADVHRCPHAHFFTLENIEWSEIHTNFIWKSEEEIFYPRLPTGDVLTVYSPNVRPPIDSIPSSRVILTKALQRSATATTPLSHCAHFHFNRMCHRGQECTFVHAAYIRGDREEPEERFDPLNVKRYRPFAPRPNSINGKQNATKGGGAPVRTATSDPNHSVNSSFHERSLSSSKSTELCAAGVPSSLSTVQIHSGRESLRSTSPSTPRFVETHDHLMTHARQMSNSSASSCASPSPGDHPDGNDGVESVETAKCNVSLKAHLKAHYSAKSGELIGYRYNPYAEISPSKDQFQPSVQLS